MLTKEFLELVEIYQECERASADLSELIRLQTTGDIRNIRMFSVDEPDFYGVFNGWKKLYLQGALIPMIEEARKVLSERKASVDLALAQWQRI